MVEKEKLAEAQQRIAEILEQYQNRDDNYIFRGIAKHTNDEKLVSSLLHDRYTKDDQKFFNEYFYPVHIENEIVDSARIHFADKTSNIEILTDLRHYGHAVTLIDFSHSLYIALFFACKSDFEHHGCLIALKRSEYHQGDIKYDEPLEDILNTKIIKPSMTQSSRVRVAFQNSVFVHAPKGYIEKKDYEVAIIDKTLKKPILEILTKLHGINSNTIYNDLAGFIDNEEHQKSALLEFYLGVSSQRQRKYQDAIKHYDKAIELRPQFTEAFNNRGAAKAELGQHKEAMKDYNKAIELNPQYAGALNNRGNAKARLEQHEEAMKDYNKVIELNPQWTEAFNNRGNVKARLGQHEEAIKDYNKATELNPQYTLAFYNRGNSRLELEQHEEAIKDYTKAIGLNPQYVKAFNNRGNSKAGMGQHKEAIEDYTKAIELNPQYADAFYNRSVANAKLGQCEEAERDYAKAIELDPDLKNKPKP